MFVLKTKQGFFRKAAQTIAFLLQKKVKEQNQSIILPEDNDSGIHTQDLKHAKAKSGVNGQPDTGCNKFIA